MNFWDFSRGPASVRLLLDFASTAGLEPARLLTGSRLTMAQLHDPHCPVAPGQELVVIENLLRLSRQTAGLGLQVGLQYQLSAYGILGYGLLCSATGADALALAEQYLPLTYAFSKITHKLEGDCDCLYFEPPTGLEPAVQRFVVERAMGAACRLLHDVIGNDFQLNAFGLRYPDRHAPINPILGATLTCGAKANVLSFRHEWLEKALPQANPITVAMCRQMCGELIEQRRSQQGTTALVRQYLDYQASSPPPSLSKVARLLNTSERTLKRWLQQEGSSFSAVQTSSRQAKAERLLADERLSLTVVADLLGFSDLSTFSQAYKRWTGQAPSHARKRMVTAAAGPRSQNHDPD